MGKYQWHGIYGVTANITLNEDSTFVYIWQQGLIGGTTIGNWRLDNNILTLNSFKQPQDEGKYRINSQQETKSNEYKIQIFDESNIPLPFVHCSIFKDSVLVQATHSNQNGVCILKRSNQENILKFSYIGLKTAEIRTSELLGNEFSITLREGNNFYEYFTNRKWKLARGKIIDPNIKRDEFTKRNYYEKVK